ncbi:GlxA family transcriptional regulator [Cupriavidus sp. 2SB]|uniref:GlxA family transcriptional regulator n=1 Tax=Cupriavidus sp. 2SB TaxID=2502199 RepID=UPI0010F85CB0|nr:GlxA family transcriptional regulator [Cupriavidus sp. 2SB]
MHRVGFLLPDGFQVMTLAAQAVFEYTNLSLGEPVYRIENYSMQGGMLRSSLGMAVETRPASMRLAVDTWIVAGVGDPVATQSTEPMREFVGKVAGKARRVASICTGAFVLAESGLLAGRRATTHWAFARDLQRLHPDVRVEEDRIHIVDGPIWTSAGMTAGLDLALAMVEKDFGAEMARSVAHKLVMYQRRSGGQSQHSELLELAPKSDRIQSALEFARKNLHRPLTVEDLAESVHLSPRQFSRVFTAETGQPPAKAIEKLRLEAARLMIEQSRHPLDVVAKETGFRDRRHLREAFVRGFGLPPQAVRREARG